MPTAMEVWKVIDECARVERAIANQCAAIRLRSAEDDAVAHGTEHAAGTLEMLRDVVWEMFEDEQPSGAPAVPEE